MEVFTTPDGEDLVKFTDTTLKQLSVLGVRIYALFKNEDGDITVRKSKTEIVWDKDKDSYISFFSKVYPIGVKNCLGIFYNKRYYLNLTNL